MRRMYFDFFGSSAWNSIDWDPPTVVPIVENTLRCNSHQLLRSIMISDNTAEVPDAKKPRLDLPPPPPVPPAPPAPPPAPVHNGSYGTQDLIAQMTARGVAKAPGAGPPGPGNMGPLGPSNVGGMLGPMMPMAHQMPMMQACRPMVPQAHACMLPLPGPPATGKPIFLAAATVPYRWADLGGGGGHLNFQTTRARFPKLKKNSLQHLL